MKNTVRGLLDKLQAIISYSEEIRARSNDAHVYAIAGSIQSLAEELQTKSSLQSKLVIKPKFPVMLRKMWSGGEVQKWLDDNYPHTPTSVPEGYALVPLLLTPMMNDVLSKEDWQWEDLLAAADAINEEQYSAISKSSLSEH